MFGDKTLQAITNTGTGTYQLSTTTVGAFKTWRSQIATGTRVFYFAENSQGTIWEEGYGDLIHSSPDTITRNLIQSSTGSLIDWQSADGTVYVFSTPVARAMEGRYDTINTMFVPSGRRPYTAVGNNNKTVAAADANGRFMINNTSLPYTVILPAISAVQMGFPVEVFGLSQANYLYIAPVGSDIVDYGGAGVTLPIPGRVQVLIWSDGTQWRTNFNYATKHTLIVTNIAGASAADFPGLPYWVNDLDFELELAPSNDNIIVNLQTYGADGVLDAGGGDYSYWDTIIKSDNSTAVGGNTAASISLGGAIDNGPFGFLARLAARNIRAATYTKFQLHSSYLDQAGVLGVDAIGSASRNEADRITGLKATLSAGTATTGSARIIGRA